MAASNASVHPSSTPRSAGECWHDEATALLEQLIGGRIVQLIPLADGPDRDRHGRLLRAVEIDGEDVGARMLEAGAAHWLDRYAHEDARLAAAYDAAEDRARQNGRRLDGLRRPAVTLSRRSAAGQGCPSPLDPRTPALRRDRV